MRILSTLCFAVAILCLIAWAAAIVGSAMIMADMAFKLGHGSTPVMFLYGLLLSFGCYAGYFASRKISYNLKYPRGW